MKFYIEINGRPKGPYSREEIEDLHGAGIIDRRTPCRSETDSVWRTVWDSVPTALHRHPFMQKGFATTDAAWDSVPSSLHRHRGTRTQTTYKKPLLIFGGIIAGGLLLLIIGLTLVAPVMFVPQKSRPTTSSISHAFPPFRPTGDLDKDMQELKRRTAQRQSIYQQDKAFDNLNGYLVSMSIFAVIWFVFWSTLSALLLAFWIWMIVAVITREQNGSDKITWIIVVALLGPIGAAIYFFVRYIRKT